MMRFDFLQFATFHHMGSSYDLTSILQMLYTRQHLSVFANISNLFALNNYNAVLSILLLFRFFCIEQL